MLPTQGDDSTRVGFVHCRRQIHGEKEEGGFVVVSRWSM